MSEKSKSNSINSLTETIYLSCTGKVYSSFFFLPFFLYTVYMYTVWYMYGSYLMNSFSLMTSRPMWSGLVIKINEMKGLAGGGGGGG